MTFAVTWRCLLKQKKPKSRNVVVLLGKWKCQKNTTIHCNENKPINTWMLNNYV